MASSYGLSGAGGASMPSTCRSFPPLRQFVEHPAGFGEDFEAAPGFYTLFASIVAGVVMQKSGEFLAPAAEIPCRNKIDPLPMLTSVSAYSCRPFRPCVCP